MRDIRGDLQDRASLLEEQINAQEAQFDQLIEQLKREHDTRLEDFRAELDAVNRLMELELRRLETAPSSQRTQAHEQVGQAVHQPHHHLQPQPQPQPQPQVLHQQPQPQPQVLHQHVQAQAQPQPQRQPQQPLADFLIRCLNEAGAMPREDLRRLALQEGYFIDAETADRGVHATLINTVKAGLIRQLPNGNFAPATALDTIRLRRAM
jgi:DNA-directed RNA polymerase specialized sigma54-like protein